MGEQKRRSSIAELSYEHQQAIEAMKSQLLIVFAMRLAGLGSDVFVPVSEVDGTGRFNLSMRLDEERAAFVFTVEEKP